MPTTHQNKNSETNVVLKLGLRRERWLNIETAWSQCLCLLGKYACWTKETRYFLPLIGLIKDQRRTRWSNIQPVLSQYIVCVVNNQQPWYTHVSRKTGMENYIRQGAISENAILTNYKKWNYHGIDIHFDSLLHFPSSWNCRLCKIHI